MGRIGIGPDDGDGGFPWSCPRCNYYNPGDAVNCMDCGHSAKYSFSPPSVDVEHCFCPIHNKPRRQRPVKEKPMTKKEKADLKRLIDDINMKIGFRCTKPKKRQTSKKRK